MTNDPQLVESLIKELERITGDNMLPLERRLKDTAIWFYRNRDRIPQNNIPARQEFLEKVMNIQLELMAMVVDRVQMVEGSKASSDLWLPNGIMDMETGKRYG